MASIVLAFKSGGRLSVQSFLPSIFMQTLSCTLCANKSCSEDKFLWWTRNREVDISDSNSHLSQADPTSPVQRNELMVMHYCSCYTLPGNRKFLYLLNLPLPSFSFRYFKFVKSDFNSILLTQFMGLQKDAVVERKGNH